MVNSSHDNYYIKDFQNQSCQKEWPILYHSYIDKRKLIVY